MIKGKNILFCAAAVFSLCGCSDNNIDGSESESDTSVYSESTVSEESTSSAETFPAASYPCPYTSEEMRCSFDGNDIYGQIYIPGNGRDIHPVVILSHGYNSAGSDMSDMAMALAENGVAAYTYDFCGGSSRSKSTGDSADMSVETEQNDLRHVIAMISELDYTDNDNIYLYGESQGGFVSALTGTEMKDQIAGMFLVYPAFCIPDDWLGKDPESMKEPFNFMGLTISDAFFNGVPRYDVFDYVSGFDKPVLLFHGDKDPVVNISYSEKLSQSFPDVVYTVVEGAGHGFSGADRVNLRKAVTDYFHTRELV